MNRRDFSQVLGIGAVLSTLAGLAPAVALAQGAPESGQTPAPAGHEPAQAPTPATGAAPASATPLTVSMLVYPNMILQDLVGPQTVFNILPAKLHLVWKDLQPVPTDVGLSVTPTDTFDSSPIQPDVLFVPGGLGGTIAIMEDPSVLDYLADRGSRAAWVTSVCTGSLVLGAAGLLRGYRATSQWYVRDLLPMLGAMPVPDRVVVDRNRMTGGGVTAGLDLGLQLAGMLRSEADAQRVQLLIEYNPQPPYGAGSPDGAGEAVTGDVLTRRAPVLAQAREAAARVQQRLAA